MPDPDAIAGPGCPDAAELDRFVNGVLKPDDDARVDRHVNDCPACQRWMDGQHPPLSSAVNAVLSIPAFGDELPPRLDGYRVFGLPDVGGMGVVWRAHEIELDRDVALKVIRADYDGAPDAEARFLREVRVCAQLNHPNIVKVFRHGHLADGRPYYTMNLVDGPRLADLLKVRASTADRRDEWLRVFVQVCEAVAYAHGRGVIHRDLKTANVMIGAHRDVQVIDWGLAKVLTADDDLPAVAPAASRGGETWRDDAALTGCDKVIGTTAYMPPEQASGDVAATDRRSDVFALGAILCEILSGAPPYTAADADARRKQARLADLEGARARLQRCGADPALIQLARRCLAADKADRPPDGAAVATAVANYLNDKDSRRRRRPLWAGLAAAAAATAALVSVLLWPDPDAGVLRVAACQYLGSAALQVAAELDARDGLKLSVHVEPTFEKAVSKVLSGDVHAATCSLDGLVLASKNFRPGGTSLAVVLMLDESTGECGVVASRGVNDLSDLRGKTVAVVENELPEYLLKALCHQADPKSTDLKATFNDVSYLKTAKEAFEAYRDGHVDAVVTYEPFLTPAAAVRDSKKVKTTSDLEVKMADVLVVNSNYLRQRPKNVERLIARWFSAVQRLTDGDPRALAIACAFLGENGAPLPATDYDLQAKGLTFAGPAANASFFRGGPASELHRRMGYVEQVMKAFDPKLKGASIHYDDGSAGFLRMYDRGDFNK